MDRVVIIEIGGCDEDHYTMDHLCYQTDLSNFGTESKINKKNQFLKRSLRLITSGWGRCQCLQCQSQRRSVRCSSLSIPPQTCASSSSLSAVSISIMMMIMMMTSSVSWMSATLCKQRQRSSLSKSPPIVHCQHHQYQPQRYSWYLKILIIILTWNIIIVYPFLSSSSSSWWW